MIKNKLNESVVYEYTTKHKYCKRRSYNSLAEKMARIAHFAYSHPLTIRQIKEESF